MKPPPINHRCFEVAAADILARAYEAFPAVIDIDSEIEYERLREEGIMPSHCDEINGGECGSIFTNTARFLEREGLIHFTESAKEFVSNVTLTSKGFVLLRSPSDLIKSSTDEKSFGERLRFGLRKTGETVLSATITALIGSLVKNEIGKN